MMLSWLLIGLLIAAFMQSNKQRLVAALIYVVFTITHDAFMGDLPGTYYYGTAILTDLFIIILLKGIDPIPRLVLRLQQVCLLSIFINITGYILWFSYLPPTLYNISFVLIYSWTLLILLFTDGVENVGGHTVNSRYFSNYCSSGPRTRRISKYKG